MKCHGALPRQAPPRVAHARPATPMTNPLVESLSPFHAYRQTISRITARVIEAMNDLGH